MTIDNLQAAFDGESNARNKYQGYAKKADEQGYLGVASLFRAAAAAEAIHAASHAMVLKRLGHEAKANIKTVNVGDTRQNLLDALAGETYERDTMYPEFIKQAQAESQKGALMTFQGALAAEAEHARLYQQALDELEGWKAEKRTFYVCEVCGWTCEQLPAERCPVCHAKREKFKTIN